MYWDRLLIGTLWCHWHTVEGLHGTQCRHWFTGQGINNLVHWAGIGTLGRDWYTVQALVYRAAIGTLGRDWYIGQGLVHWAGIGTLCRHWFTGQRLVHWAGIGTLATLWYIGQALVPPIFHLCIEKHSKSIGSLPFFIHSLCTVLYHLTVSFHVLTRWLNCVTATNVVPVYKRVKLPLTHVLNCHSHMCLTATHTCV